MIVRHSLVHNYIIGSSQKTSHVCKHSALYSVFLFSHFSANITVKYVLLEKYRIPERPFPEIISTRNHCGLVYKQTSGVLS